MRGLSLNRLIPSCFTGGARSKTPKTAPEANPEVKPKGILKKPNQALKSSEQAGTSGAAHGAPSSESPKSNGKALAFSPPAHVPGQDSPISLRPSRVRFDESKNTEKEFEKSKAELKAEAKEQAKIAKAQAKAEAKELARQKRMDKIYNDERW